jgi:phosphoglycerate dehydrogenase-like enzyme
MKKYKLLYQTSRAEVHQQAAAEAAPENLELIIRRDPSREEMLTLIADADFLITEREEIIDEDLLSRANNLKLIQRLGRRVFDIDLKSAKKRDVPVCSQPVETALNVSEHMMMQILSLLKRNRDCMNIMNPQAKWDVEPKKCDENTFAINWTGMKNIRSLHECTVGILGFGEIGYELALRLKPFRAKILYNKRRKLNGQIEKDMGIEYRDREEIYKESDIICSLLPLLPGVESSINRDVINLMKRGSYITHCGASSTINEKDVAAAIETGQLAGFAADTYAWEPVEKGNPLVSTAADKNKNIILTPHIAVGCASSPWFEDIYSNIVNYIDGKPLKDKVI